MKIVKDNLQIVCDVKGCDNIATYKLIMDVGGYECMRICEKCLKSFYKEASKKLGREEIKSEGIKKEKSKK